MWKTQKKLTNRAGHNIVKEDYSKMVLTEEDRLRLAISSSANYNKRLLEDRRKTESLLQEVVLSLTLVCPAKGWREVLN